MVTVAGGKELDEPIVVRPTSETVIGEFMAKWIQSYRDLPLLLNQWANVVRWELRPRLFLRTSEFLWQEGHTAHATQEDARAYAVRILHEVYENFMVNVLALPVLVGLKTARERFAGAAQHVHVRGDDGRRQGAADGHQPRARPELRPASSGSSSSTTAARSRSRGPRRGACPPRMVGGLIMAHGDDDGLRVPPHLAPVQVVVLAVRDEGDVVARVPRALADELRGERRPRAARRQDRACRWAGAPPTGSSKGVPIRLEVGPRDLADDVVTLVRRITGGEGFDRKLPVELDDVAVTVQQELERQQSALLAEAGELREARTADVADLDAAREAAATGWAAHPLGRRRPRRRGRARAGRRHRALPHRADGSLPESDDEPELVATVARAY